MSGLIGEERNGEREREEKRVSDSKFQLQFLKSRYATAKNINSTLTLTTNFGNLVFLVRATIYSDLPKPNVRR